jgi:hypothetical protein
VADIKCILSASAASVDTHRQITLGTIVKLANWLRGDGAIDVDLANHNSVVRDLLHEQVAKQPVLRSRRTALGRAILTELCAAVFAVGGRNTIGGGGRARDLHDEGAIVGAGKEVFGPVTITALELRSRDLVW